MTLSTSIEKIPRIGLVYQKRLRKMGIKTVRDLLFHFPHRYDDFSNILPISQLKLNQTCSIQGKILKIENTRTWKKRMILTQAIVEDDTGATKVVWFNQPYLIKTLKEGDGVSLSGKVLMRPEGTYLSNPAYEKLSRSISDFDQLDLTHTARLVPVYPETEGLSSRWLRYIIRPLLVQLKTKIPDPLPEKTKKEYKLLSIEKALWQIHFPDSRVLAKKALERFSFEELFFLELFVLRERMKIAQQPAASIPLNLKFLKNFVSQLPFNLTGAQKKSLWQVLKDLEKTRPMNRLLEGEVGSGKTVVAMTAALSVNKAGYQTAFMAPTEILAKQHFKTISAFFNRPDTFMYSVTIGLLTGKENKIWSRGKTTKVSRKKFLEKVRGEIDILIGTHALIQDKVKFKKLVLVILDEQHRFGVEQRARLCQNKGGQALIPHLLSMTATPIPRTLSLTIYGDLDLSLIDELPKGRKKIITKVVAPKERQKTYDFIRKEVKKGRRVFVICPRIEPSTTFHENGFNQTGYRKSGGGLKLSDEAIASSLPFARLRLARVAEVKAVKEEYQKLSKKIFPDLKVGMLHGKMKPEEKEKIMSAFAKGRINLLVSTSVVEVGIDVPLATVMMIEGAERFGLAQLHQFRGRVGRSKYQSYCFLLTDSPAQKTRQRLKALISSDNGFELAEKDLEIRGPGDFSGSRQWGIPDIVMVSLKNIFLVEKTRKTAKEILEESPQLKKYPLTRDRLKEFGEKVHLE